MNADEALMFDMSEGVADIKIVIKDSIECFNSLIKKGVIEELESRNVTVVHENIEQHTEKDFYCLTKEEKRNFRRIIYEEVRDDPLLSNTFVRIFGTIDETPQKKKKKIIKIKQ